MKIVQSNIYFNNTMKMNSMQNNASANLQEALKIILNHLNKTKQNKH